MVIGVNGLVGHHVLLVVEMVHNIKQGKVFYFSLYNIISNLNTINKRACNNSIPSQGGSLCRGDTLQIQNCNTNLSCPINGNWTDWGSYSACSTTCGTGVKTRVCRIFIEYLLF